MKLESKFYNELKRITPQIRWTRIDNTSVFGTPDLLGYNDSGRFFTVELKVSRSNKVCLSPHQISFHVTHPKNSFILVKSLAASTVKLYEGSDVKELVACGLELEACCLGLAACGLHLSSLGAWSLLLEAFFFFIFFLMFAITHGRDGPVPACAAISAFVALSRCRAAGVMAWSHSRRPGPELNRRLVYHVWAHSND